jgi:hypothetical protein
VKLEESLVALVNRYDKHIGETVTGYSRIAALEASMHTLIANGGKDRYEALKERIARIENELVETRRTLAATEARALAVAQRLKGLE